MSRRYFVVVAAILCAAPLVAQDPPPASSSSSPARPARRAAGAPCWQQAGLQKSAIEELRSIQQDTHTQIESVCSNASLTPQQRHQRVQEIREHAHQKLNSLMTSDQRKALMACREARGEPTPGVLTGAANPGCSEGQRGAGAAQTRGAIKPANPPAPNPSSSQN